jgi:enolase
VTAAPRVRSIQARGILDSRGLPTVECEMVLAGGHAGRAAVPSGASTGEHEALELRDADPARWRGLGVSRAVRNIRRRIAPTLLGRPLPAQARIDKALCGLDGTPNKRRLGANAILAVSMAAARARAAAEGKPLAESLGGARAVTLPIPLLNVLNGGAHADNTLDLQEFMIAPHGARSFTEALRMGAEVYQHLKALLSARGLSTAVGDEGGFAPRLGSHEAALDLLLAAIRRAGYRPGRQVSIALDPAASELYLDGRYVFRKSGLAPKTSDQMIAMYRRWVDRYPIVSIEDGLAEDDWAGWRRLTEALGRRCWLVGDDLFVTNTARLARGIAAGTANAVLIKLNQVGTVTETLQAIRMAQRAGYGVIISHRSGETEDTFISELAVAVNAGRIKTGAPCRAERTAKYNELLRIEERLGRRARYPGAW